MSKTILYNGRIHTQADEEIYSVMAIDDRKIAYVGDDLIKAKASLMQSLNGEAEKPAIVRPDAEGENEIVRLGAEGKTEIVRPDAGEKPEIVWLDAGGKTIIPGFVDSHTHPSCVALTNWRVPLKSTTLEGLLQEAADYCKAHPVDEVSYFFGESFQLTMFDEHGPRKELLDQYISDRPARLQDFTDHSCWYNSRALELMNVRAGLPDPDGLPGSAKIVRDPDGEPTGWVQEIPDDQLDAHLYKAIGWEPDHVPTEENLRPLLKFFTSKGITTMMDAIAGEETLQVMRALEEKGQLPFHFDACVLLDTYENLEQTIEEARRLKEAYESEHVHIHTVKFFLDGTNELGDMASLEPLRTDPTGRDYGTIYMETAELTDTMVRLNEAGFDLHMHMVGDRAFRTACDAMEKAEKICGDSWRIQVASAHCELTHPDDRLRPVKLGMFINWSCHWAGGYFGEKSRDYLGQERFDTMYDFTQMLAAGTKVAFSSDVFSYKEAKRADPFFGIQCSATRIDPEFPLPEERFPGHVRTPITAKLSVKDLIRGYTATAAEQLRLNDRIGTLQPGKDANFLILNANPYTADPMQLSTIQPSAVWFEGRTVYQED